MGLFGSAKFKSFKVFLFATRQKNMPKGEKIKMKKTKKNTHNTSVCRWGCMSTRDTTLLLTWVEWEKSMETRLGAQVSMQRRSVALRMCAQPTMCSASRVCGCSRLISSVSVISAFSTRAASRASASVKLSAVNTRTGTRDEDAGARRRLSRRETSGDGPRL